MVPDHWYVIAESRELSGKRPLGVTRFGRPLVLWRSGGEVRAISDVCPHRGAALSLGEIVDGCVACPFHGFTFDGGGACTSIPAGVKIPPALKAPAEVVREAHGWIWLWYGEPRAEYPPIPWFEDMPDLPTAWFADDWPVHWTRAVENQLDFSHLTFVHKTTIGRFTSADAKMTTEVAPGRVRAWSGADRNQQFIEWLAPNIWRNKIGPDMWIQAAFVPIDEGSARTYVRFAQGMIGGAPGRALCWLMNPFNKVILAQDRRVVVSQRPIVGEHGNGDRLLAIDEPIAAFRAWRARELKRAREGASDLDAGQPVKLVDDLAEDQRVSG